MKTSDKPLFIRSLDISVVKKIDKIVKDTGAHKNLVINNLLANSLKIKPSRKLDLKKWLGI